MYRAKLWIYGGQGDPAEEIMFESERSMRGAKSKLTRWIKRHYCISDIVEKKLSFETSRRADFNLTLYSPWASAESRAQQ